MSRNAQDPASSTAILQPVKDIILFHHSAIPHVESQYDTVRDYHNRGAPDVNGKLKWPAGRGIQYSFFIEKSGELIEGNPPERVTWHSGSWKWNQRAIGICLAGDLRTENVTGAQLKTLAGLTRSLQTRFDIPDDHLFNHRDCHATECPGRDIREMVINEKNKVTTSKIDHLRKAIDRSEPPRKYMLERLLSRLIRLLPL